MVASFHLKAGDQKFGFGDQGQPFERLGLGQDRGCTGQPELVLAHQAHGAGLLDRAGELGQFDRDQLGLALQPRKFVLGPQRRRRTVAALALQGRPPAVQRTALEQRVGLSLLQGVALPLQPLSDRPSLGGGGALCMRRARCCWRLPAGPAGRRVVVVVTLLRVVPELQPALWAGARSRRPRRWRCRPSW